MVIYLATVSHFWQYSTCQTKVEVLCTR